MATISLQDAYTQARTFLEANQIEQAIGLIQHILEHHPDNLEAQRLLGEAYLAKRDLPAATATFEQVLQVDPENIPAHVGLGMAYEWQGRLDKAIAEFEQALEIRPDMPELRAQLVRLYTEAWGSEHAALRLSRPGLARLYARGHMLPQAIHEFRQVIAEHPDRLDAWVGLIESLWRDGQLDEAAIVCQDALKLQPHLLKANLILGAILLSDGDQRGLDYWQVAQRIDPYQTVAKLLFDALPASVPTPDVSLPAWDETEWQARRAASVAAEQPAATPAEDFFAETGWLTPAASPVAATVAAISDDDLLAMLLFSPPAATSVAEPTQPPAERDEFDFDLDLPLSSATPTGLTLDEIGVGVTETPPASAEPTLQPFSLEELGLSPEEIAQLEGKSTTTGSTDTFADDLSGLQPFSLDDLDFGATSASDELPATLQPFSLDDLALDDVSASPETHTESIEPGIYSWQEPSARGGGIKLPQEPEPGGPSIFSKLVERAASLPPVEEPPLTPVELTEADVAAYFSNDDVSLREDDDTPERLTGTFRIPKVSIDESLAPTGAVRALSEKSEPVNLPKEPELTPFSLEELGLSPEEIAQLEAAQQPATGETTDFTDESIDSLLSSSNEGDVFAHLDKTGEESSFELPGVEPFSLDEFADLEPFSFEDIESGATTTSELGLSPDEIDSISLGNFETVVLSDDEEPMIDTGDPDLNRLIKLGHRQGYVDLTDIIAVVKDPEREADRIEQIGWSLYRAGIQIRDGDEIIDMEAELGEEEPAPATSSTTADLTPFDEEPALAPTSAEPELTPFSLEELGLSPEEIAQLEAAQQAASPSEAGSAEDDLFDFSIAETAPVAKAVRTAPRIEEPPPPPAPEDTGFVPEPLDALDDIWNAPPEPMTSEPARVVLPPLSERPKAQPMLRTPTREERRSVTPTRDDLRFARREALTSGRGRSARAPIRPRVPEDFIPTGNATIDDYLRQLSTNPANHTLAFTIARLCAQTGQAELMAVIYRRLLKHATLLDRMAEELEDLINTIEDTPVLRQLYRILGDVYSRQGRLEEAIATYSVTFAE